MAIQGLPTTCVNRPTTRPGCARRPLVRDLARERDGDDLLFWPSRVRAPSLRTQADGGLVEHYLHHLGTGADRPVWTV